MTDELNPGEELGAIKRHRDDAGNPSPVKVRKIYDGDSFFIIDPDGTKYDVTAYVGCWGNYDDRPEYEGWKP